MEFKEQEFELVSEYFLHQTGRLNLPSSLEIASPTSPSTRILVLGENQEQRFVIKILREGFPTDKNIEHLENEMRVQFALKALGFRSKEYLLVDTDPKNLIKTPFYVSSYLKGQSLENSDRQEIEEITPRVLDYLFRLHVSTITNNFGFINTPLDSTQDRFSEFEAKYLLADIARDSIPFSVEQRENLTRTINSLDRVTRFCLAHCDVTVRNTLWNGKDIDLIDWTYSHYSEPGFDIANVVFWLAECGLANQLEVELLRSDQRYKGIGFDIAPSFLFYLSQRYIEYGRIKGKSYIEKGKILQKYTPSNIKGVLESIQDVII